MANFVQGNVCRITVVGSADNQAVVNQFHFAALGPDFTGISQAYGLVTALIDFQAKWQAWVCPILNENYKVQFYRGETIMGRLPVAGAPGTYEPQISDRIDYPGNEGDAGTANGLPTPTFEAFSVRYIAQPKVWKARGGSRLGPVTEADTQQNSLTIAALERVQEAANKLAEPLVLAPGTDALTRVIFSLNGLKTFGLPFTFPDSVISKVTSAVASPFISSQVSRKRRQVLL